MSQQPPVRSADGQWFWDGSQWKSLLSTDGRSIWNGSAWEPLPPGSAASSPPPPPSASAEAAEPRPSWLPADQPWPPAVPTAAPAGPPPPPPAPIDWNARREAAFGPLQYSGTRYAGFWIRLLALIIDDLIVSVPVFIIAFAFSFSFALANPGAGSAATSNAAAASPLNYIGLAIGFLYFTYFWSTGATIGMRVLHLKVVDAGTGGTIGFGKAALRYVGYLVASFCCAIGLIWAAFDGRKQGWHDKIAGTYVVHAA